MFVSRGFIHCVELAKCGRVGQCQALKFPYTFALQYRRLRTSGYLTCTSKKKAIKALQKFKLKQAKMQCDDEIPTYLKGGTRDKILFNITLGLLVFESINAVRMIHDFCFNT